MLVAVSPLLHVNITAAMYRPTAFSGFYKTTPFYLSMGGQGQVQIFFWYFYAKTAKIQWNSSLLNFNYINYFTLNSKIFVQ